MTFQYGFTLRHFIMFFMMITCRVDRIDHWYLFWKCRYVKHTSVWQRILLRASVSCITVSSKRYILVHAGKRRWPLRLMEVLQESIYKFNATWEYFKALTHVTCSWKLRLTQLYKILPFCYRAGRFITMFRILY